MKKKSFLKSFWNLSIIATIIFAFIPKIGIRVEGLYYYFGFPANCLTYYKGPRLTPEGLTYYRGLRLAPDVIGIVFNIAFFYFVFFILSKIFKKIKVMKRGAH